MPFPGSNTIAEHYKNVNVKSIMQYVVQKIVFKTHSSVFLAILGLAE
jgi:hypothetical protein